MVRLAACVARRLERLASLATQTTLSIPLATVLTLRLPPAGPYPVPLNEAGADLADELASEQS